MSPMERAVELVEVGALALMASDPRMTRLQALTRSAVVVNATFSAAAVLVAEQAAQRAWDNRDDDPFDALRQYVDELRDPSL